MTRGASAPDEEREGQAHGAGILRRPIGRRAFLEVAAASMLGALGARPVAGGVGPQFGDATSAPAAEAPDVIGDLAAELEYDVDRTFRFVADEVRYGEMDRAFDRMATWLRRPADYRLTYGTLNLGPGELAVRTTEAGASTGLAPGVGVEIILDTSGSMAERIEGRPRIEVPRDALARLVGE